MPDDISIIKNKYNVTDYIAAMLLEASIRTGMILPHLYSIYNVASNNGSKTITNGQFLDAIRTYNVTKMSTSRKVGTKDDFRTNVIKRSPYNENGNIELDEKGKRLNNDMRYVSTRKMLHEPINDTESYREHRPEVTPTPPKYYYVNLDGKFDLMGHELSPAYDKSFLGFHSIVPYVKVTQIRTVSPSRYPKPIIDSHNNIVGHAKSKGFKLLAFDSYYNGRTQHVELEFPYESNVGFDSRAGRDLIINEVRKILNVLMTPEVERLYKEIKEEPNKLTLAKHIASSDEYKKQQTTDKIFKDFYGEGYKEERKRKVIKSAPKRKICKKICKKPIKKVKKCTCTPSQKRKIISIRKKITGRRYK